MPCPFALTVQLLYGGIGDAIALTATAPLNRITLILQTQQASASIALGTISPYDGGVMECGRRLVAEQGIWSLWQGNFISFGYTTAFKSLSVFLKDYFLKHYSTYLLVSEKKDEQKEATTPQSQEDPKRQQEQHEQQREAKQQADVKAGILAGCASILILYPINYALTCISTDAGSSDMIPFGGSVQDCVVQTIRTTGIFGLYKGLGMMLASFLNYQLLYLDLYKRLPPSWLGGGHWKRYTVGHIVGCLVTCMSYPLDTISRRMQVQIASIAIQGDASSAAALSANDSGLSQDLYAGMAVKLLSSTAQSGILRLYDSERNQDLLRKVVMKFFH
jgi:solute carrier family 25 (adenine nucleotide translocator) protein 4/5/6/31